MGQWTDRIKKHAVWQHLQSLGPAIDQGVRRDGVDADTVDGLERLRAVLTLVGKRLAAADPATTYPAPLDGIATALQNATAEVQNFVANGNVGHVTNANTHGDTALAHLTQVPVPTTSKELAGLKDAAVSYRSTLEEQLRKAGAASSDRDAELDVVKTKVAELGTEIAAERQRLSELSSGFQAQFSTAQETRNKEYTEAQGTRQEKFGALMTETAEDVDALKKEYGDAAKAVLDQIDGHRRDVEKLVGVIGDLGVTSGYVKTANYARKAMWAWQLVAVAAMSGVIYAAYKLFIPQVLGQFSWEAFAGRAILTLTVGVLAAYAARQGDKYHEMERQNRQRALDLAALGPFLAPLPEDKQNEFRLGVGAKTFGQNGSGSRRRTDRSPATVLDLADSPGFTALVAAVAKAIRGGN
jgi:hypothetical protein